MNNKKMKIMQVVTSISDDFAGPSYSVPALCSALQDNGCDVTLYTLGDLPKKSFNFTIKTFPRGKFPTPKLAYLLGLSPKMLQEMKKDVDSFDIIHSHMLWKAPNYYSGFVAKDKNKPYLISPRGTVSSWALNFSKWKKKIVLALGQKKALDAVTCFHATSEEERKEIVAFGYPKTPCTVIPNGIDIPEMQYPKLSDKKRLVFLSRIHEKKGVDILIKSWKQVEKLFPEWELSIVGPNEHEYAKKMQKLVIELDCQRITFEGEIYGEDKIKFLQQSYLFVLPTHSENFGMVVAEALVNEVPVICSKGAPWEGLETHDAGWWIDIGEEALIKALKTAMDLDSEELLQKGKNGRKWMINDFSWDKIAKQLIDVYQWLLNKKEKPVTVYEGTV
jgi:glycosyltransferase involved in cell wall biosynthesis